MSAGSLLSAYSGQNNLFEFHFQIISLPPSSSPRPVPAELHLQWPLWTPWTDSDGSENCRLLSCHWTWGALYFPSQPRFVNKSAWPQGRFIAPRTGIFAFQTESKALPLKKIAWYESCNSWKMNQYIYMGQCNGFYQINHVSKYCIFVMLDSRNTGIFLIWLPNACISISIQIHSYILNSIFNVFFRNLLPSWSQYDGISIGIGTAITKNYFGYFGRIGQIFQSWKSNEIWPLQPFRTTISTHWTGQ